MSFHYRDGYLYCEDLKVSNILDRVGRSPFYLYSAGQIAKNYHAYADTLKVVPGIVSYAVKANGNLKILKLLQSLGSWVTLASGNELKIALEAGFKPQQAILNGNGKTLDELWLAIDMGAFVNVDSEFDLAHIQQIAEDLNTRARVLIRVNPDIDPEVHPYISTGLLTSKFGIGVNRSIAVVKEIGRINSMELMGIHCHLGSNIYNLTVYQQAMEIMADLFQVARGVSGQACYINLGGGLGIDYQPGRDKAPEPSELISVIREMVPEGATLILEPGRSIVGNAGVLVCRVIGVKRQGNKRFLVIDGSMAELIRPSLYHAYHEIEFIEPVSGRRNNYDVVGPVCESADFLGKDRWLPPPLEGAGIVIFDAGAYGHVMSSNYNARSRPGEYLVEGEKLVQIRRTESIEDQMRMFDEREVL